MIDNTEDIIDSRDIVERIKELADAIIDGDDAEETAEEFASLTQLVETINDYGGDSAEDGVILVRDSYFETYAQELASDLGYMETPAAERWPFTCIDWEWAARELQHDYTALSFDGVTYWFR